MADAFREIILDEVANVGGVLYDLGLHDGSQLTDISGNGFHGTHTGSPTQTDPLTDDESNLKAASYNGTDQYSQTPTGETPFSTLPPITLGVVLKTTDDRTGVAAVMTHNRTNSDNARFEIHLNDGVATVYIDNASANETIAGDVDLRDGEPHLVVASFDSNTARRLHVDGALVASGSTPVSPASAGATLRILTFANLGRSGGIATMLYQGALDEAFVLNGTFNDEWHAALYEAMSQEDEEPPMDIESLTIGADPEDPRLMWSAMTDLESGDADDTPYANMAGAWKCGTGGLKDFQDCRHGLIVDLTDIPAGSTIISATLSMRAITGPTDESGAAESEWGLIPGGFVIDEMTYNSRSSGVPWTTPGGDFDAELMAPSVVMPVNGGTEGTDDEDLALDEALQVHNLTNLIQHALDHTDRVAHLMHRLKPGTSDQHMGRYMPPKLSGTPDEYNDPANLPILFIQYAPPGSGAAATARGRGRDRASMMTWGVI